MALNGSGQISLGGATAGQSIATELGQSPTGQISLNDTNVRSLAAVPSGAIIMPTNFYGKSVGVAFNQTISVNTVNYNLRAAAVTAGWNQTTPLNATITINSGVYVYSTSTGAYAFRTGTTFPAGTSLKLINNGTILGMGGAGSNAAVVVGSTSAPLPAPGSVGGPALLAEYALSITNNGVIGGGGGGGGAGSADR
jgi:predicted ATP-grasp superfamily ATP-dependent carboligase